MNGYRLAYEDFIFDEYELIKDIWFESFIDDMFGVYCMNTFEKHFKFMELSQKAKAIHKNNLSKAVILVLKEI